MKTKQKPSSQFTHDKYKLNKMGIKLDVLLWLF